ncbi:MAG: hypothetical protein ACPGXL_02685 [Chitinophagales bacterium]
MTNLKSLVLTLITANVLLFGFSSCELFENDDDGDPGVGIVEACSTSSTVIDNYEADAIRLALRAQQDGPAANEIQIPQALIDRMLAAISAVYNGEFQYTPEFAARDTVIDLYDIHTLPYPDFDQLTLEVDTSVAWVQEWVAGNRLTGNSDVDNLMTIYGLDLDGDVINLSLGSIATIKSSQALNLQGLAETFANLEGVVSADFNNAGGSGNDITVEDMGTFIQLTFTLGWDSPSALGECVSACDFSRSWVFEVSDSDCSASFIDSFGDVIP